MASTNSAPRALTREMTCERKSSDVCGGREPEITRHSISSSESIRSYISCSLAGFTACLLYTSRWPQASTQCRQVQLEYDEKSVAKGLAKEGMGTILDEAEAALADIEWTPAAIDAALRCV